MNPGRRSQTRFTLGYHLSGFQPCEYAIVDASINFRCSKLDFGGQCDKVQALVTGRGGRPGRFDRFPIEGGGGGH